MSAYSRKFRSDDIEELRRESDLLGAEIAKAHMRLRLSSDGKGWCGVTATVLEALVKIRRLSAECERSVHVSFCEVDGTQGSLTMGARTLASLTRGMRRMLAERVDTHLGPLSCVDSTLRWALVCREELEGVGERRTYAIKALLDSCSHYDAVCISIVESVFVKGQKVWGDKPWEKSEGHTRLDRDQTVRTITLLHPSIGAAAAEKLIDDLLTAKIITSHTDSDGDTALAMTEAYEVESHILTLIASNAAPLDVTMSKEGLNADQEAMLDAIVAPGKLFRCVDAPGGTGKSHTVARLVAGCIDAGLPTMICAPTGNAAKVASDFVALSGVASTKLIGGEAMTVDRAYAITEFAGSSDLKKCAVLVLDEASMLSSEHMRLIAKLPNLQRVIMLGDLSQLPPIRAGAPFADIAKKVGTIRLTKNMRAEGSAELLEQLAAARKNSGFISKAIPFARGVRSPELKEAAKLLQEYPAFFDSRLEELEEILEDRHTRGVPILAHAGVLVTALGNWACARVQKKDMRPYTIAVAMAYLQGKLYRAQREQIPAGVAVYWAADRYGSPGEPLVYRGYTGVMLENNIARMEASLRGEMTTIDVDLTLAGEGCVLPWFSSTVHKAQGRSVDEVCYFVKALFGDYSQALHYTATSRARKKATVISLCVAPERIILTSERARCTNIRGR